MQECHQQQDKRPSETFTDAEPVHAAGAHVQASSVLGAEQFVRRALFDGPHSLQPLHKLSFGAVHCQIPRHQLLQSQLTHHSLHGLRVLVESMCRQE